MRSVHLNQKVLSTAENLLGHDVTYTQTNEQRFPPTTPANAWQQGDYLEWQLPASSIDHDVMADSYFDVVWSPVLIIGKSQPRVTYRASGMQWADPPVPADNLNTVLDRNLVTNGGAAQQNQSPANGVDIPYAYNPADIKTNWDELIVPLPPQSGFVPSQGFFHDLFSDVNWDLRNSGQVRTIQGIGGTYQFASKVLELLDSKCARYGTAKITESHGAVHLGEQFEDFSFSSAPVVPFRSGTDTLGTAGTVSVPVMRAPIGNQGSDGNGVPTYLQQDYYSRLVGSSAARVSIISGRPIGYDVLHENSEWLHLCLTVGRENPDVYSLHNVAPTGTAFSLPNANIIKPSVGLNSSVGVSEFDSRISDDVWAGKKVVLWGSGLGKNLGWASVNTNNGIEPIPASLFTLRALIGCSSDYNPSARACALYRNRQVVSDTLYHHKVAWDVTTAHGATTRGVIEMENSGELAKHFGSYDRKRMYYRNAYRPKEGIFQIDSDIPAYSSKTVRIRLGNFSQAYVGSPLHDFNELSKLYYENPDTFNNLYSSDKIMELNEAVSVVSDNIMAAEYNKYAGVGTTAILRLHSPFYNSAVGVDVSYGIKFERFDLIAHRHRVSTEVEGSIRAAIMQAGLARYPVRRVETNLVPLPPSSYFDSVLFDNTSADLVILAVMRNQAVNFSQATYNSNIKTKLGELVQAKAPVWTKGTNDSRVLGVTNRFVNGNNIDSFACAPKRYQKCPIPDDSDVGESPSVEMNEMYLLVNGLKEPNLGYQPDNASGNQFGNDIVYKKVINEIMGAGYPDIGDSLPRSVWESNVRLFAFNLTPSKYPINSQGSNLPAKKSVAIHLEFPNPPKANTYSIVALAITQQAELEADASGNFQMVY